MKKIFVLFLLSCCLFTNCKKDTDPNESTGIITGRDLSKCYCCWGWLVEIENKTYKFDKIPSNSLIDLEILSFPTTVKIKWRDAEGSCKGKLIEVLSISKQ